MISESSGSSSVKMGQVSSFCFHSSSVHKCVDSTDSRRWSKHKLLNCSWRVTILDLSRGRFSVNSVRFFEENQLSKKEISEISSRLRVKWLKILLFYIGHGLDHVF